MPLYRDAQVHYSNLLQEARSSKDAHIVSLMTDAQECVSLCAADVAKVRSDCENKLRSLETETQGHVDAIEQERLQNIRNHQQNLLDIERKRAEERDMVESRLQEIERETQALCDAGDARVCELNAKREAAMKSVWQRCTELESLADEKCHRAQQREQEAVTESRVAVRTLEARRARHVMEVHKNCEKAHTYSEQVIVETQKRVAERLQELVDEAKTARNLLTMNRERANLHMEAQLQMQADTTASEQAKLHNALVEARMQFFEAGLSAQETAQRGAAEVESRERERVMGLGTVADELQARSAATHWLDALQQPRYVQGLEELAEKLRSGKFWRPIPPPVYTADLTRMQVHRSSPPGSEHLPPVPTLLKDQPADIVMAAPEGRGISSQLASSWGRLVSPEDKAISEHLQSQ